MLTLLGGIIGIGLGVGGAFIVSHFAKIASARIRASCHRRRFILDVAGDYFRINPANKAAKLDPIEALRYE